MGINWKQLEQSFMKRIRKMDQDDDRSPSEEADLRYSKLLF